MHSKTKTVMRPNGLTYNSIQFLIDSTHVMIAGTTGSGKSTLLNAMIWQMLYYPSGTNAGAKNFYLIDPKRVELYRYRYLWHTMLYASEQDEIETLLASACLTMDNRYESMRSRNLRTWDGDDVYIIIDEYADLCGNKKIVDSIIRIAQLGRASKFHLILCTQRPTSDVITGKVKTNIDTRVALRVPTAQDSRNILGFNGAESLQGFGYALCVAPEYPNGVRLELPYITDAEIDERVQYLLAQTGKRTDNTVASVLKPQKKKKSFWGNMFDYLYD